MSDENVNDAATPRSVDQQQACSHAWCAWCGKWGDHTSGGCKSLALDSRVAREEQATVRLLSALRLIAAQNCQTKAEIKEMVATMRRIARDAIESHENVSDQTPRTQDVANTTDSLERLSASVLFGLLLLVGFISGPSSVGAQETPIDHPRPAESHRTTDKMDNTGNPIILGNEAEPRLEALSANTYGKSAFGSFGEPSPQTSGTAHSALESSLTDQVGSLSGGERASESTMQARRLSPTGFVLLGVIVQLLLMAATWSNVVPVEHPKWLSLNIRYTAVAVLITMLLQPYVLSLVSSLESSGALIHCPNAQALARSAAELPAAPCSHSEL